MATISSRTPEGGPNWCPTCRSAICVEPGPMGDAPCPNCGTLPWFYDTPNGRACCQFAAIADRRDRIFAYVADAAGMSVDEVVQAYATRLTLDLDSLEEVELVVELEEEFNITIPDQHAENLKTY